MARSEAFWNNLYLAFNPNEILVGERGESLYCEREYSPYDEMKQIFRPTLQFARPPIAFFAGHRGSGKSSLLFRLLEHCHPDFFVVYFDIEHNLDKEKANQIDLLYLFGTAVFQAAVQEGVKPEPKHLQELHDSIYTITNTTKQKKRDESFNAVEMAKDAIVFGASMLGSSVGAKLAEAALKPFSITSGVSDEQARKREIEPQVQQVINNVNFIIHDVQTRSKKPVLVVVDGLDKLNKLEQAKLIFLDSRALTGPVCRIIYTVPMLIRTMPEFRAVTQESKRYLLPNIKTYLCVDTSSRYQPGYDTLHEVVAKRLHSAGLGQETIFEPDVLDYLISKSGGVLRWFIEMTLDACMTAERKGQETVNKAAAQQAVAGFVADLTASLTTESHAELRLVHEKNRLRNNPESSLLLQARFIVAYRNGETWYDAHPLFWERL